ncbi:MAG TPA: agmatinase [Gemmatimonadaceae bacterium]
MPLGIPTLIGLPYDASSSFLRGPAEAPPLIREAFRSPAFNAWSEAGIEIVEGRSYVDAGDVELPQTDEARELVERAIAAIVARNDRPLSLGGDHSLTYPILRAVGPAYPNLTIVQFDAHSDLYDAFEGDRYSHATPFARILEEKLASRLVQIGIRALTPHQREQATRFGVDIIDMRAWARGVRPQVTGPVYVSIDVDGIDPGFAPGVSHREPGGLSVRDVLGVIQSLPGPIVGADVVEVNPSQDESGLTPIVGAKLVRELISRMIETG